MIAHLENLDYVAIAIYILLMAIIGLSFGWFVKDTGAYFKGNGAIPWLMASITSFFSLFSTFVFIAYAGIAYRDGLVAITVFWATVPACIIGGSIFAKRWRRTGHTTPMQYLEQRYNLPVQQTITWVGLVMRFLDNMVRIYAIGIFIVVVTPISLPFAIILSGIIITTFNIVGGLWSVVVMSIVQFLILIFIVLILLPISLIEVGGISVLNEKIPEHMTWFNGEKGNFFWLAIFYIMTMFNYNQNWTFIQKFYCVKDEKAAMKVGIFAGILFFIFTPIFLLPAVTSSVILPDIPDPEMSYVALSKMLLPAGLMGILFASMFAATMSTLNGEFNIMSSVLTNDVYRKFIDPHASEKKLLKVARITIVLIGTLVTAGGIYIQKFGGAFEANKLFTGIFAIPVGFPLLFGILFKRPNAFAAILTILVGVSSGIILNSIPAITWECATLIEICICAIIYFTPGYFMKQSKKQQGEVDSFFNNLQVPIKDSEKPVISFEYKKSMVYLFVFSFIVSGILFISMSLFSIKQLSGQLGTVAGAICFVGALVLWIYYKLKIKKQNK